MKKIFYGGATAISFALAFIAVGCNGTGKDNSAPNGSEGKNPSDETK